MLVLIEPAIAMLRDETQERSAAVARAESHPDPWARAMLHLMISISAENDGDIATVEQHMPLSLALFHEVGDRWGIGSASGPLSNIWSARGEVERAITALQEARQLMIELHSTEDESYSLIRIGVLRMRLGDQEGARRDVEAGLEIARTIGSVLSVSSGMLALAAIAHGDGQTDEARQLSEAALAMVERTANTPGQIRAVAHCALAGLDIAAGDLEAAGAHLVASHEAVLETRDMPVAAVLALALAEFRLAQGDPRTAAKLLGAAVAVRGMEDVSDLEVKRVEAATRAALSPPEYDRSRAEGRTLPRAAALALIETALPPSP